MTLATLVEAQMPRKRGVRKRKERDERERGGRAMREREEIEK
jgi:hypothetical protein